jgi:hypothetical protein
MRHLSRSSPVRAAAAGLLVSSLSLATGCGGGGSRGAATAVAQTAVGAQNAAASAVNTGVQVIQQTVREVQNVPKLVFDMARDALTARKQTNWGQPQTVFVHDQYYVLIYPTPVAEQQRTGPRMVVIPRNALTEPQAF